MLLERENQIDAEYTSGQPSIWREVHRLMRCPGPSCHHQGQFCWQHPAGKKHYKLRTHHLRSLIKYVEQGGILETHDDVLNVIREELYAEEQQRLERGQPKSSSLLTGGTPYPINIDVLLAQSPSAFMVTISTTTTAILSPSNTHVSVCLKIPGARDEAVKAYSQWQELNVADEILKADRTVP